MTIKFLSYPLNASVPTYGNRLKVNIGNYKSIAEGSTVNESFIELPLHAGTHIDFPNHFYENGPTVNDFDPSFWLFQKPLIVELTPDSLLIGDDLIDKMKPINNTDHDILIIKTDGYKTRGEESYWSKNFGIHAKVAGFLREHFPTIRCIGFDSISLTSIMHRDEGKEAHLAFLNPDNPILIIEDMDLSSLNGDDEIEELIVSPLRVENVDGVSVTCLAKIK